jgi:acyl carrier protein
MMIDRDTVREFVGSLLRRKEDTSPFTDSDSLVLSGRLDSIDILQVVMFLEARGIDFNDQEFDQDAFDSVDRILTRIELQTPATGASRT